MWRQSCCWGSRSSRETAGWISSWRSSRRARRPMQWFASCSHVLNFGETQHHWRPSIFFGSVEYVELIYGELNECKSRLRVRNSEVLPTASRVAFHGDWNSRAPCLPNFRKFCEGTHIDFASSLPSHVAKVHAQARFEVQPITRELFGETSGESM